MSLSDLINEGDLLLSDAGNQRTANYHERRHEWAWRVEDELKADRVAVVRFNGATRSSETPPGIPESIMSDWQILQGRVAVLVEIHNDRVSARTDSRRFWGTTILTIVGIIVAILLAPDAWRFFKSLM